MSPTVRLALIAALALGAPAATAQPADLLGGGEESGIWDDGLAWGVGIGGAGLAGLAAALYYLGVGGLRHIDRENVLDHPMRQSLLQSVQTEPGVHLRELAARHGTAVTNTQWHLRKLELAGLLKTQKVQGRRLYYPTEGGVAMKEQALQNAATTNPNAQAILDYLAAHSGCNQRTLAEALGMNPGTVRWHLRKMESAGLVRSMPEGTMTRYFLLKRPDRPPRPGRLAVERAEQAMQANAAAQEVGPAVLRPRMPVVAPAVARMAGPSPAAAPAPPTAIPSPAAADLSPHTDPHAHLRPGHADHDPDPHHP